MSGRKNFSRSGAAILLSVFGLMGFDNNMDSRVDAMDQNKQTFFDINAINDSNNNSDGNLVDINGESYDNPFAQEFPNDSNNTQTPFDDIPDSEFGKYDITNKNKSGGNDEKDNDEKDNNNNKWSTGKKVGVITAVVIGVIAIIGGAVLAFKRRIFGKKNTQTKGLPAKNLDQNSKLNTNLNLNSSNNLNQKSTNLVK